MKTRNYKRVAYGSTPYAFRFSGKPEESAYRKQLDEWIKAQRETDQELSPSQALNIVVKGLMDKWLGYSLSPVNADNPGLDVGALKQGIIDELKEWFADTFSSPEKAAQLARVSQSAADGNPIDSDVIANILEDFGR
jgi:hypothetical protein